MTSDSTSGHHRRAPQPHPAWHVDSEVARRIERAEGRLLEEAVSLHRRHVTSDAFALPIGGGVAVGFDATLPINKVIGAGFDDVAREDLDRIEGAFSRVGVPTVVELCPLARRAFAADLAARQYRLTAFENALALPLSSGALEPSVGVVKVRDVTPAVLPEWSRVVAEGFGAPAGGALERMLGPLMGSTPRTRCLLAEIDGEAAGGAAVRIEDGVALSFATSTLPRFRQRGVQRALVETTIFAARMADADLVVATTDPGSQSQRTFERVGFRVAYSRAILSSSPPQGATPASRPRVRRGR